MMNIDNLSIDPAYLAYMKKVSAMTQGLPRAGQREIQNEISSHIYESLRNSPGLSVQGALEKFGEPDAFLPEWVVLKKLEMAVSSFDPIRILRALFFGITRHTVHAFKYLLFGILYLLTFIFAALSIIKVIIPERTGLLISQHGFILGHTDDVSGYHEVLGWWFIPISLFAAILFYVMITLLLKRSLQNK